MLWVYRGILFAWDFDYFLFEDSGGHVERDFGWRWSGVEGGLRMERELMYLGMAMALIDIKRRRFWFGCMMDFKCLYCELELYRLWWTTFKLILIYLLMVELFGKWNRPYWFLKNKFTQQILRLSFSSCELLAFQGIRNY